MELVGSVPRAAHSGLSLAPIFRVSALLSWLFALGLFRTRHFHAPTTSLISPCSFVYQKAQKKMKISVIIPVRNEEDSIGPLLDALLNQSLPPTEIVITDGGSTDSTAMIIQRYVDQGAPVRLIRTTRALPGRGRNLAVSHSSSEWLAFMDAGVHPDKKW